MATRAVGWGSGSVRTRERVRADDRQPVLQRRGERRDGLRQRGREGRVDLDGDHRTGHRQQRQGQRAQPRADLDHDVLRPHPGQPDDAAHGVGVDDEVLAPLLGRADTEAAGDLADLTGPQQGTGPGRLGLRRLVVHVEQPRGNGEDSRAAPDP